MGPAAGPSLHPLRFCDHGCETSGSRRLLEQLFSDSSAAPRPYHKLCYKLYMSWESCKPQCFFSFFKLTRPEMKLSLFYLHLIPPCFLSFNFLSFSFSFFNYHFSLHLPGEVDANYRYITEQKWKKHHCWSFWEVADSRLLMLSTAGPQSKTRFLYSLSLGVFYCCMFTEGKYAEISSFKGSL